MKYGAEMYLHMQKCQPHDTYASKDLWEVVRYISLPKYHPTLAWFLDLEKRRIFFIMYFICTYLDVMNVDVCIYEHKIHNTYGVSVSVTRK